MKLCRDGLILDDAVFTKMEGRAFGGRSSPGYCSVIKPLYTSPGNLGSLDSEGRSFSGLGSGVEFGWLPMEL
jgi:hypothetical protein